MKNEDDLIFNLKRYYDQSMAVINDFGGPSVYFHVQTITEQKTNFLSDRHIEMIYATLSSWGMHRMGDTRTKMVEFEDFKQSILLHSDNLKRMLHLKMDSCTQEQYEQYLKNLKEVYFSLKVSISNATIVAHSKTLAHILPNLIPPVDRQYTIRFFTQDNKNFFTKSKQYKTLNLPQGLESQFSAFKEYSSRMKGLFDRCDHRLFRLDSIFNTSYPKIIDNLIMAFVKDVPKP